jgi:hypothetical protein
MTNVKLLTATLALPAVGILLATQQRSQPASHLLTARQLIAAGEVVVSISDVLYLFTNILKQQLFFLIAIYF